MPIVAIDLIKKHIKTNIIIYFIIILCLLVGISVGGFTVKIVSENHKQELVSYLRGFFSLFHNDSIKSGDILSQSLINNFQLLGLCYVLGLSIIGIIGVFFIMAFKGFVVGFTVGLLIEQFKFKGCLLFMLGVLPQNLIIISVFIAASVVSSSFALAFIKDKLNKTKQANFYERFLKYTGAYLGFSILILIAVLIETLISPIFIKMIGAYIQ
ncbi:MAG TPA: stage II sporulation protein M [Oscillospiraceae bacterium]|nr:stage II sporulation protein M [Oscillospiraceae bacterium]